MTKLSYKTLDASAFFNSAYTFYKSSTNRDIYESIINAIDCAIHIFGILGGQYANPLFDAAVFGWTAGDVYDDWSENKEGE